MNNSYIPRRSFIGRLTKVMFSLAGSSIYIRDVSAANIKIDIPQANQFGEHCGLYGGNGAKQCKNVSSPCDKKMLTIAGSWAKCCCLADGWQCCRYHDLCIMTIGQAEESGCKNEAARVSGQWCNDPAAYYVCTTTTCSGTATQTFAECSPSCH